MSYAVKKELMQMFENLERDGFALTNVYLDDATSTKSRQVLEVVVTIPVRLTFDKAPTAEPEADDA